MGSLGASSGTGPGGPALVTSWAMANGGGWRQAGAGGWCYGGRGCGRGDRLLTSAILSGMAVSLPIIAVGVGILFGGHVWGGWTCAVVQNRLTD